mgnify:CR=1 FL=1
MAAETFYIGIYNWRNTKGFGSENWLFKSFPSWRLIACYRAAILLRLGTIWSTGLSAHWFKMGLRVTAWKHPSSSHCQATFKHSWSKHHSKLLPCPRTQSQIGARRDEWNTSKSFFCEHARFVGCLCEIYHDSRTATQSSMMKCWATKGQVCRVGYHHKISALHCTEIPPLLAMCFVDHTQSLLSQWSVGKFCFVLVCSHSQ